MIVIRRVTSFGVVLLMTAFMAAKPMQVLAQDGQSLVPANPDQPIAVGSLVDAHGFFQFMPNGGIVLYPVSQVVPPEVMYTILGMFGSTNLVNSRGFFRVAPDGGLLLYAPAGLLFGQQGPRSMPWMHGQAPTATQPMAGPSNVDQDNSDVTN